MCSRGPTGYLPRLSDADLELLTKLLLEGGGGASAACTLQPGNDNPDRLIGVLKELRRFLSGTQPAGLAILPP